MTKSKKKCTYQVAIKDHVYTVLANGVGHACELVFPMAINDKIIKSRPKSNNEGLWQGVSVTRID